MDHWKLWLTLNAAKEGDVKSRVEACANWLQTQTENAKDNSWLNTNWSWSLSIMWLTKIYGNAKKWNHTPLVINFKIMIGWASFWRRTCTKFDGDCGLILINVCSALCLRNTDATEQISKMLTDACCAQRTCTRSCCLRHLIYHWFRLMVYGSTI